MPTVSDEAICIRVWDWSETSQTVSLFGRSLGLLRGLAKGSKRDHSKFSGGIDLLTRGQVVAIVKSADTLATLTSWDLSEIFPAGRRSLPAFYVGMYLLDLIHHAVRDADPHPALFDALLAALRRAQRGGEEHAAMLQFQWSALVELGYMPDLEVGGRSGGGEAPLAFDPARGGLSAPGDSAWLVRPETIAMLRRLRDGEEASALAAERATVDRANRLLAAYFREILGSEPPAMAGAVGTLAPFRNRADRG